jgi:hypothetical protein
MGRSKKIPSPEMGEEYKNSLPLAGRVREGGSQGPTSFRHE